MRYFWSRFIIFSLCIQSFLFAIYHVYGSCGILQERQMQKIKIELQEEIDKTKKEIESLQEEILSWSDGLFLQEKFAREKLHLKKENEIIYLR